MLYKASEYGILDLVTYFLGQSRDLVDIPNKNGNTPLYIACVNCPPQTLRNVYPSVIKALVKYRADLNFANSNGNTPMFGICYCGNPNFAEILVAIRSLFTCGVWGTAKYWK